MAFFDLEKAYGRVDKEGFWWIRMYGVNGKLLSAVKNFNGDRKACDTERLVIKLGVRQGCVDVTVVV